MLDSLSELWNFILTKLSPPVVPVPSDRLLHAVRSGYSVALTDNRGKTRKHSFTDIDSLIAYVGRHGTAAETTFFCDARRFTAVLRDVDGNDRDVLNYIPQDTEALKRWCGVLGRDLEHSDLRKFVEDRADDVTDRSLLAALTQFSARTEIAYDADLDTSERIGFVITNGQKKGQAMLPKRFVLAIPIVQGWPKKYEVSVRLDWKMDGTKPTFKLDARNLADVREEVINDLSGHADHVLGSEWLVVRGVAEMG